MRVSIRLAMLTGIAAALGVAGDVGDLHGRLNRSDPGTQAAIYLLGEAARPQRDGEHNQMLRALRHLKDPRLQPYFERLSRSESPAMRIHGILGLAELRSEQRVDLQRVAEIDEPVVQAELITAAMDGDLLATRDAQQVLGWNIDLSVKVLTATRLVEQGTFGDVAMLQEAVRADTAGRRGLAALLLHQLGEPSGTQALQQLGATNDPQRDVIHAMLLQTAARHGFARCGNWAFSIATDESADRKIRTLALQTAMRLGEARATALWRQRFESTTDAAERIRLALIALRESPWLDPSLFDAMRASEDELIARMGRAGAAIAGGGPGAADQVVPLLLMHHPLINGWALEHARQRARDDDAQLILLGLVRAYEHGPERTRAQRLDHAIQAAQILFDRYPDIATQVLAPVLRNSSTDRTLVQGILLGAVRSSGDPSALVATLPEFDEMDAQNLAILLRARSGAPMTADQIRDLQTLARGGGRLQPSMRTQAGWLYLVRTGQADAALSSLELP